MQTSKEIEDLVRALSKLPALGPRSAKRIALHLLKKSNSVLPELINVLNAAAVSVKVCEVCGNLDTSSPCLLCQDAKRDRSLMCIVKDVADAWALERSGIFKGLYHILGGNLSALNGVGPSELNVEALLKRVREGQFSEVIIALDANLDGLTTSHYIAELLEPFNLKISRIAYGVPVGGELDYLDDGTISQAIKSRQEF